MNKTIKYAKFVNSTNNCFYDITLIESGPQQYVVLLHWGNENSSKGGVEKRYEYSRKSAAEELFNNVVARRQSEPNYKLVVTEGVTPDLATNSDPSQQNIAVMEADEISARAAEELAADSDWFAIPLMGERVIVNDLPASVEFPLQAEGFWNGGVFYLIGLLSLNGADLRRKTAVNRLFQASELENKHGTRKLAMALVSRSVPEKRKLMQVNKGATILFFHKGMPYSKGAFKLLKGAAKLI